MLDERVQRALQWTSQSWVQLRKIIQTLAFLFFLYAFINLNEPSLSGGSNEAGWKVLLSQLPLQLDPLVMLANILASRQFLFVSLLAMVTVLGTLVLGRVWCGWLCPMGTLLDWFSFKKRFGQKKHIASSWRSVKYVLLIAVLTAAIFSNLTLLILDPITLLYRTFSTSLWPALDHLVTAAERLLYRVPFVQPVLGPVDSFLRPEILPFTPVQYQHTALYGVVFAGVLALNLITARFWCRYLCPLGGLLGFLGKFSVLKHTVSDSCSACGACLSVCPTGAIFKEDGRVGSDPAECTVCMSCIPDCPTHRIGFRWRFSTAEWQSYDPGRRQVVLGMGASLLGVGLMGADAFSKRTPPHLIRPPGAQGDDFLNKCIRCGACVHACPTGAIQPALFDSGLEGLWTPVLVPRLGYCDYSCHACGEVCPVGAIPDLTLEDKRTQVLGKAYIDQNRCIAWVDGQDCIVCEEMCPISDKAIILEESIVSVGEGGERTIHRPHVRRELCIGCGICEYQCPVAGPAAIRVFTSSQSYAPLYPG